LWLLHVRPIMIRLKDSRLRRGNALSPRRARPATPARPLLHGRSIGAPKGARHGLCGRHGGGRQALGMETCMTSACSTAAGRAAGRAVWINYNQKIATAASITTRSFRRTALPTRWRQTQWPGIRDKSYVAAARTGHGGGGDDSVDNRVTLDNPPPLPEHTESVPINMLSPFTGHALARPSP